MFTEQSMSVINYEHNVISFQIPSILIPIPHLDPEIMGIRVQLNSTSQRMTYHRLLSHFAQQHRSL